MSVVWCANCCCRMDADEAEWEEFSPYCEDCLPDNQEETLRAIAEENERASHATV